MGDPKAKALVFVQWADLEGKVCRALQDHGVPFLCLSGASGSGKRLGGADGAVLRRFQEEDQADAPFVLVLSLQRAAAGANLTAASHVLFVHPMNAESVDVAAAYERQALARVRRIGQTRKEVHVWRFVTKQTVEEHIWKLHHDAPEGVETDHVSPELERGRAKPMLAAAVASDNVSSELDPSTLENGDVFADAHVRPNSQEQLIEDKLGEVAAGQDGAALVRPPAIESVLPCTLEPSAEGVVVKKSNHSLLKKTMDDFFQYSGESSSEDDDYVGIHAAASIPADVLE